MISWEDIQKEYKNEWVAMAVWEEDEHGDVIKGDVIYHHPHHHEFYDHLKENLPRRNLAIRYTGNVTGPFFLHQ